MSTLKALRKRFYFLHCWMATAEPVTWIRLLLLCIFVFWVCSSVQSEKSLVFEWILWKCNGLRMARGTGRVVRCGQWIDECEKRAWNQSEWDWDAMRWETLINMLCMLLCVGVHLYCMPFCIRMFSSNNIVPRNARTGKITICTHRPLANGCCMHFITFKIQIEFLGNIARRKSGCACSGKLAPN